MKNSILFAVFLLVAVKFSIAQDLKSPNAELEMKFEIQDSIPVYSLSYKGKDVIKPSKLGLELKDQEDLLTGFSIEGIETTSFDETWKPYGVRAAK